MRDKQTIRKALLCMSMDEATEYAHGLETAMYKLEDRLLKEGEARKKYESKVSGLPDIWREDELCYEIPYDYCHNGFTCAGELQAIIEDKA